MELAGKQAFKYFDKRHVDTEQLFCFRPLDTVPSICDVNLVHYRGLVPRFGVTVQDAGMRAADWYAEIHGAIDATEPMYGHWYGSFLNLNRRSLGRREV